MRLDEIPIGLLLVVVGALLSLQGIFCASEIAFFATGTIRARRHAQDGTRGGKALFRLLQDRSGLVTTILVVITGVMSIAEGLLAHRLGTEIPVYGHWIALVGLTIVVVYLVEVTPAVMASRNPERTALLFAPFVLAVHWTLLVLTVPLRWVVEKALRLLGLTRHKRPTVTEDELITMIDESDVDEEGKQMMLGAIQFADRTVSGVMVPRGRVVAVEESDALATALDLALGSKHSRLPVYRERDDDVVGIIFIKDLLPSLRAGRMDRPVHEVMRPPYHVPETMRISELLPQFQSMRRVVAVAVDEFGAAAGLVTMEDLLEEIVGDILDEYDDEIPEEVVPQGEGVYLVDGRALVHEVNRQLSLSLPEDGFETVAGLVNSLLGRMPEGGEQVTCDDGRIVIDVLEMKGRRVSRVRLTCTAEIAEPGDGAPSA